MHQRFCTHYLRIRGIPEFYIDGDYAECSVCAFVGECTDAAECVFCHSRNEVYYAARSDVFVCVTCADARPESDRKYYQLWPFNEMPFWIRRNILHALRERKRHAKGRHTAANKRDIKSFDISTK